MMKNAGRKERVRRMRRNSDIVKEMLTGIFAVCLFIAVVGLIFVPQKVSFFIGLGTGFAVAVIMVFSMYESIGKALDYAENGMTGQLLSGYALRTAIMLAGLIGMCFLDLWALAAYFLGVMSLKTAAYMQPCTSKLLHHKKNRG